MFTCSSGALTAETLKGGPGGSVMQQKCKDMGHCVRCFVVWGSAREKRGRGEEEEEEEEEEDKNVMRR